MPRSIGSAGRSLRGSVRGTVRTVRLAVLLGGRSDGQRGGVESCRRAPLPGGRVMKNWGGVGKGRPLEG